MTGAPRLGGPQLEADTPQARSRVARRHQSPVVHGMADEPAMRRGKNALPAYDQWPSFIFLAKSNRSRQPVRLQRVFIDCRPLTLLRGVVSVVEPR
jgi:hypothetical protein